jgi:serine/threonine protein phosphatase PrpC
MQDDYGNKIGPFRVWHITENFPGLAMSRSLGDQIGKSVGVSALPFITTYNRQVNHDMFIVAASDGLWEVMENEEVANFVEKYRHMCLRETTESEVL